CLCGEKRPRSQAIQARAAISAPILKCALGMKKPPSWILGGIAALILLGPKAAATAVSDPNAGSLPPEMRPPSTETAVTSAPPVIASTALQTILPSEEVDPFPARTYGKLDARSCLRELDDRFIAYERYGHARGVSTPVRLTGPLQGIYYVHAD